MKEFFKMMFASMAGFIISGIVFGLFGFLFLLVFVAMLTPNENVYYYDNTLLEINLNYSIPEKSGYDGFGNFSFDRPSFAKKLGLNDIVKTIDNAANDSKIGALFINLNGIGINGFPQAEAIRRALIRFKESGKNIYAHGDEISQTGLYLATAADKIFLTPTGDIQLKGFGTRLMYFKGTLDKLEIEAQIFRKGKYKSAVEMYSENKMSENDKEQFKSYLEAISDEYYSKISESRNISFDAVKNIFTEFKVRSPQQALDFNLVDSLCYIDDVLKIIEADTYINTENDRLTLQDYSQIPPVINERTSDRIAIVYATGEITGSSGNENEIGIYNVIDGLEKARDNYSVKAIVLRVNSPGGIPLTSDLIANKVKEIKRIKPVIVSMGNVAASGGYYISAMADSIVAEATTLTGSIGVYGMIPNVKDFMKNKLGITVDGVGTGKYSDYRSIYRPVTETERKYIEQDISKVYKDFITVVSDGRNMTPEEVDKIGQGRIWSGVEAKEIGLVDELGGLERALEIAAEKAGILSYKIIEYPRIKEPLEMISEMFSQEAEAAVLKLKLGENYRYFRIIDEVKKINGIQTRLPYYYEVF